MNENKIGVEMEVTPEQDLGNFKAYLETFKEKLFVPSNSHYCPLANYRAWQIYQAHECDEKWRDPHVLVYTSYTQTEDGIHKHSEWEEKFIEEFDRAYKEKYASGAEALKVIELYEGGLL